MKTKEEQANSLLSEAIALTLMPLDIMAQKYNTDPTEEDRRTLHADIMQEYNNLMHEIKEDARQDEADYGLDPFGLDPAFSSWDEANEMFLSSCT